MNQDKIGLFIKQIRLDNNLTQKEFADLLGVTYQAVSKWENGKNVPDIGILKQISEEFHVNIDELLNGEKTKTPKKKNAKAITLIGIILIISFFLVIIVLWNLPKNGFEFKTISSKCSDFKITGSAAYNKEKTSIFISNIEFCGKESNEKYQEINCTLYEKNEEKIKKEISSCKKKDNITLKDYLKEMNIKVDNYSTICKKITSNTLFLEIDAKTKDNKNINYIIPLKLENNC